MALVEGCLDFYRKDKYTDIILVTADKKKFNCHKFVFGAVSNVFEKMFFLDKENTNEICLEITSDSFAVVIDYVYKDQLIIDSEDVAINLYKFAFQYKFNKLLQEVKKYFTDNLLTVRSSLKCLNILKDCGVKNLLDCCKIKENVHEVIECEEFLNCPLELVVELTCFEEINMSELDLFNSVEKWMNHKKELQGAGEDNLKIFYNELVKHIRFLAMTETEFLGSPFNSYLLTENDKLSLLGNICVPGSIPLSERFSTNRINRYLLPSVFENIEPCFTSSIKCQTLKISKLKFNDGKEHISPPIQLFNKKGRFNITMKFNIKNNEQCLTIGVKNCSEIAVNVSLVHLDIKDVFFRNCIGFTLAKNQTKEFKELTLTEINEKGCLIDNLEFDVTFYF